MKTSLLLVLLAIGTQGLMAISIQTTALPNGILKDSYLGVIAVGGGCTPYKWKVTSGSLPPGVTMKTSSDTKSVTLAGTPTKAASYSFTVAATGCGGGVARHSYKVVVQARPNHVVDLIWHPSSSTDVTGYNVYRGPDGKSWKKINVSLTASTVYSDSTAANSSTYYYAATAVDIRGNESRKSNIAKTLIP
jgi:hypothetical protein